MKFTYLIILMFSFAGIAVLDYKHSLAIFSNAKAAVKSIVISASLLLLIDITGVNWKIFSTNQAYVVGVGLGSENIPIEEVVLLLFICYFVLCVYRLFVRRHKGA